MPLRGSLAGDACPQLNRKNEHSKKKTTEIYCLDPVFMSFPILLVSGLTASRYVAWRLGIGLFVMLNEFLPGAIAFSPASQVSISELLDGDGQSAQGVSVLVVLLCREIP